MTDDLMGDALEQDPEANYSRGRYLCLRVDQVGPAPASGIDGSLRVGGDHLDGRIL